jgi:hypothetical protein
MSPRELVWLLEAKRPKKNYGGMTEAEAEESYQLMIAQEAMNAVDTQSSASDGIQGA